MSSTVGDLAGLVGGVVHGDPQIVVSDVIDNSREADPRSMFVAVKGRRFDGHDFLSEAIEAGCRVVCVDASMQSGVTELLVSDTRRAMGPISSEVHGNPSHSVNVIGVTGTNGKTTVTHYVNSIAQSSGLTSGLIGTVETRLGDILYPTVRTTPEAPKLQRLLGKMRDEEADLVSVEVSSHALDMGRTEGTRFAVAAFTNLSQDHLDYHGTMDAYRSAKLRLFAEYEVGTAVINVDDPVGARIADSHEGRLMTVGSGGDIAASAVETSFHGSTFSVVTPFGTTAVHAPVVGRFNIDNLLIAMASCLAVGISLDAVVAAASRLGPVPGRFEVVSDDSPVTVIIDYAHTPEGIREAIAAARLAATGRIIALVGAGGDRDRAKRPLMGQAAAEADLAIITSDNPRSEDPDSIIAEVITGLDIEVAKFVIEADRRKAIDLALDSAGPGDVALILGKGHEKGQEISGVVYPFDDRAEARQALGLDPGAADSEGDSGSMSQ